jgi:starch-binding outer membrane protein, SusD/RagB family
MKTRLKIATTLIAVSLLAGCDDYITQVNPNTLTTDSFWKTPDDAFKGLMATYGAFQLSGVMGGGASVYLPVRSDVGRPNNFEQSARSLQALSFNDNTGIVKEKWRHCYVGIFRANQVLDNLPKITMDEKLKVTYTAEARFIRGVLYYWLASSYNKGSVVLHTTVQKTKDEFAGKLMPREEVYKEIFDDLNFAQQNLPPTWNAINLGRATWGAATAMLGNVKLNEKMWGEAAAEFKKIMDSNLYSLTPEIGWNFDKEHEFNAESIFEVSFSVNQKPGLSGYDIDGANGSEATSRAKTLASSLANGYRVVMPSYWATMLFKSEQKDMTDPRNVGKKYSIRCTESIDLPDDGEVYYQKPSIDHPYNNTEAAYMKKFQNWKDKEENNNAASGINERVVRLADVYLMYAEAILETGGDASKNQAIDLINKIRKRSGVVQLDPTNFNAASTMQHIRFVERPLELMFEGHDIRWTDLRRWGIIKDWYTQLAAMQFVQESKVLKWAVDASSPSSTIMKEYVEAAAAYTPGVHDYFPIPADEQLLNKNLGN